MHADCSWVSTGQEVARKIAFLDTDMGHRQLLKTHTAAVSERSTSGLCLPSLNHATSFLPATPLPQSAYAADNIPHITT